MPAHIKTLQHKTRNKDRCMESNPFWDSTGKLSNADTQRNQKNLQFSSNIPPTPFPITDTPDSNSFKGDFPSHKLRQGVVLVLFLSTVWPAVQNSNDHLWMLRWAKSPKWDFIFFCFWKPSIQMNLLECLSMKVFPPNISHKQTQNPLLTLHLQCFAKVFTSLELFHNLAYIKLKTNAKVVHNCSNRKMVFNFKQARVRRRENWPTC